MRILVIQPDPSSPAALVEDCLRARGVEITTRRPDLGEPIEAADREADGVVLLGGAQSVLDPEHREMFGQFRDLVRSFHGRDRPVLGICLGAQVMAETFGAAVRRADELQFGFRKLRFTPDAATDPLLGTAGDETHAFCWHEDRFDVPDGAVHLAASDAIPAYAFRIGRAAYAFQCHFEVTPASLREMLDRGAHLVPTNLGAAGEKLIAEIDRAAEEHLEPAMRFGTAVTQRWIDRLEEKP